MKRFFKKIIALWALILLWVSLVLPYGNHDRITGKSLEAKVKIYKEQGDNEWRKILERYISVIIRGSVEEDIHPLSKRIKDMSEADKRAIIEELSKALPLEQRILLLGLWEIYKSDFILWEILNAVQTRSHFYSPITRKGLPACQSAVERADGLYHKAVELYGDPRTTGEAFETLGHAMHLLQDMGSPSHVHNAIHVWHSVNGIGYENYVKKNWWNERWYSGGSIDKYLQVDWIKEKIEKKQPPAGIISLMQELADTTHMFPFDEDDFKQPIRTATESENFNTALNILPLVCVYGGLLENRFKLDVGAKGPKQSPNDVPDDFNGVIDTSGREEHYPLEFIDLYIRTGIKKGILTLNFAKKLDIMYGVLSFFSQDIVKTGDYSKYEESIKKFFNFQKEVEALIDLPEYKDAFKKGAEIAILKNGYYEEMNRFILNEIHEPTRMVEVDFYPSDLKDNPILIIPSGGLFGLDNSEQFKAVLRNYVENGGFLIVFAQQHGYEFSALPTPDGKPIIGYGWREDQSCQSGSVRIVAEHPALSGLYLASPSIMIDGYFEQIPENSTVLLRSAKNGYPVAFQYQLGNGYIFVISNYEDWQYHIAHGTFFGKALIRDFISYAKKPTEIKTYDITHHGSLKITVSLNIDIRNITKKQASKIKLIWLDPDRNIYGEEEHSISLSPDETTTLTVSREMSIPTLKMGIWHIDYILYDSQGEIIQFQAETDSGRFIIKVSPYGPDPISMYQLWVTTDKEEIFEEETVAFTLHFKNNSRYEWKGNIEIEGKSAWRWTDLGKIENLIVPPGVEITIEHPLTLNATTWVYFKPIQSISGQDPRFLYSNIAMRRIVALQADCSGKLSSSAQYYLRGEEERFTLNIENLIPYNWPGKAKLKIICPTCFGGKEKIIYESEKEFFLPAKEKATVDFSYSPPKDQFISSYRAETEIIYKDRIVKSFRTYFNVDWSRVLIYPSYPVFKDGQMNNVTFTLINKGRVKVNSGKVNLKFRAPGRDPETNLPNGEILYEDEKSITLDPSEKKEIIFSIPFPYLDKIGEYPITYEYSDETGNTLWSGWGELFTMYSYLWNFDKPSYLEGENALLTFFVSGGSVETDFIITTKARFHNYSETTNLHYNPIERDPLLQFTIPIPPVFSQLIPLEIRIKSPSGSESVQLIHIPVTPIDIELRSSLSKSILKIRESLDINYEVEGKSGFISPIPAQLKVEIPSLNYQSMNSLNILPGQVVRVPLSLGIPETIQSALYSIKGTLILPNGKEIVRFDSFTIQPPTYKVSLSKNEFNGGEDIVIEIRNEGGVEGSGNFSLSLRDSMGVIILSTSGELSIPAGGSSLISLPIPQQVSSGIYTLSVEFSGFSSIHNINIKGIESSLNVQTKKERYLKGEDIESLSTIVTGENSIENGKLKLEILRRKFIQGGWQTLTPTEFSLYNTIWNIAVGKNGWILVETAKGYMLNKGSGWEPFEIPEYAKILFIDSKGRIWAGTSLNGVWSFKENWTHYTVSDGLSGNSINFIEEDSSGNIWFATDNGITKYDGVNFMKVRKEDGCPFSAINCIRVANDGSTWISSQGNGIAHFDGTDWLVFQTYPLKYVYSLAIDKDGTIWAGTRYELMRTSDGISWEVVDIPGLNLSNAFELEVDGRNHLWLKNYEGIIRYDGMNWKLWEYGKDIFDDIYEIVVQKDGEIHLATQPGIRKFDGEKFRSLWIEKGIDGLIAEPYCIEKDAMGIQWIGTYTGLCRFDGKEWRAYLDDGAEPIGWVLKIDIRDGVIFLATDRGVKIYDGYNWKTIPYPRDIPYYGDYPYEYVTSLLGGERIFIGNRASNVELCEYSQGRWVLRNEIEDLFGTYSVYDIELDKNRTLWIAGDILISYDNNEWKGYSNIESPTSILYDSNGFLWVSSSSGLWKYNGVEWNIIDEINCEILDISEDLSKRILFLSLVTIDTGGEMPEKKYYVFTLEGDTWSQEEINFSADKISAGNFLALLQEASSIIFGSKERIEDEKILTRDLDINQEGGTRVEQDIIMGKIPESGRYILKGTLLSFSNQELTSSEYQFSVVGEGITLTIGSQKKVYRLNDASSIKIDVFNGGSDESGLNLKVWKKTGESQEDLVKDEVFDIQANGLYSVILNLHEGMEGIVSLRGEVWRNNILVSNSLEYYEVSTPSVKADVSAPEFAGDESFDIKVSLKNSGKTDSSVNVKIQALSFEEDVSLKPNEERTILIPAQITQTTDYQIEFSGDYQETIIKRIEYGYSGSAELGLQPVYPKGEIVIPVLIKNTGRMDWSRNVRFELLNMQGILIQKIERTYTLSSQSDFSDNLSFILSPGEYTLRYSSTLFSGEGRIRVSDPGIGVLGIEQFQKYPEGKVSIPFTIENKDSFAGDFEINFIVKRGDEQIASSTQRYLIQPNEKIDDKAFFELSEGNYTLEIQGAKIGPISPVSLSILPYERVSWSVSQEPLEGGSFSLNIQIQNSGFSDFNGSVLISSNFFNMEDTIEIGSGENKTLNYSIPVDSASIGENSFTVSLIKSSGEELFKEERKVTVLGDDIQLTEIPSGLIFNAGENANIPFKIKNLGNKEGTVIFSYRTMDLEETEVNLTLKAGEEKEISVQFTIPDDLPDGDYSLYYRLEGKKEGEVRYKVQGIAIEVSANLDKPSYKEGETAHLTLNISKLREGTIEGFAKVNYLGYEEEKEFELSSSVSLTFDIPLPQITPEKVFYGIYHRDGRGVHLNSIYIYKEEDVKVLTDKQVYKAGENVSVSVTSTEAGVIKLSAPGYEEEFEISGTVSRTFTLPANLKAGTYGVSWEFRPSDTTKLMLSGTHLFDVDGLLVKVVEAMIDKGKYNPGEQIQLKLMLESNRDIQLTLRAWVLDPEGNYNLSGEGTVSLRKDEHTLVTSSYPLETSLAGIHRLIYALYDSSEELVVSGSESFDCGGAVLLGVRTEKSDYPVGNESVKVHLDLFGEGSAELKIFLENEEVKSENLSLSGIQTKEIELEPSVLKPGILTLKAEILKDNLKSSKETSFIYGSNLPDLTVQLQASGYEQATNPLTYKIKATIRNEGKSPSSATTVAFFEGDTLLEEKEVHALNPDEEIEVEINYDGRGKAGRREIIAEVDKANTVREFNENNNRVSIILEIPEIFHEISLPKDEFSAFEDCTIITRIFNNRENALSGEIEIVVSNISSNQIVFERKENVSIAPFTEALISSVFNTGTYPEGEYKVSQKLTYDTAQLIDEKIIRILRTERVEGNLTIQPKVISPNKDEILTATVELTNRGNVAINDGELRIEIKKKETGEKVDEKRIEFSIDINESKTIQEEITVNLHEGFYILTLLFNEEKLDEEEIECRFVIETVKKESLSPRVLVLDNTIPLLDELKELLKEIKDEEERERMELEWKLRISKEVEFVENALKSAGILYRIEKEWMAQAKELRKGVWNIIILLGSKTHSPFIEKEMRERVFKGDGLIVTLHHPWEEPFLREVLGVKTEGFLGWIQKVKKTIQTFPTPISSEGEFEITARFTRIVPESENLLIAGKIKNEEKPVIVLNNYGEGKAVTFAFPLSVNEQENENAYQVLKQILISSIFYLSPKKTSDSSISRLVPIELNLSNPTSKEMEIRVKEVLQQNVKVYLRYPQDEQDRQERQDELTWKIKLQPGSSQSILYIAELPDQVGSYEFKSEIYLVEGERETKIDEKSLTFNVEKKVKDRIREIIVELEKLPVQTMKDRTRVRKAIQQLERILGRNGESWLNLSDVLSAIDSVKEIESADPTSIRNSLIDIMLFYERRVAESGFMWN